MAMTLEAAIARLGDVERKITVLLKEYERETGLEVCYVHLRHEPLCVGSRTLLLEGVTVDVALRGR